MLDSTDNGIIMGEAIWTKHPLPIGKDMNPTDLITAQSNVTNAVVECMGKESSVAGFRFKSEGVAVDIYTHGRVECIHVTLPYEVFFSGESDIVIAIEKYLADRQREQDEREAKRDEVNEKNDRKIYEQLRKRFENIQ